MDKLDWAPLGAIVAGFLLTVWPPLAKYLSKKLKVISNYFIKNLEIRSQVEKKVGEIRVLTQALRVTILEFSNSEETVAGLPFEYLTATYESTDANIVPVSSQLKKIPVSQYASFLLAIDKANAIRITCEDAEDTMKYSMQSQGTEVLYAFKLGKQLKNGCILLAFGQKDFVLTHQEEKFIELQCWEIANLMQKLRR